MKKHLFLLIFTLLSALLRAQTQVDFFKGSFEEAKQLAKTQKKLIFIDFYTQWCSPCKAMELNIFNNEEISDLMNGFFVNLHLDAEREGDALARRYGVTTYPTTVILDSTGGLIQRTIGYKGRRFFLGEIETEIESLPYGKYYILTKDAYYNKKPDFNQVLTFASLRKKLGILNEVLIDEVVAKTSVKELKQMKYQLFLHNYALKVEGRTFDFILEHRDWDLFKSKLKQLIDYNFNLAINAKNKYLLKRVLKANTRIINDPSVSELKNEQLALEFYQKTNNPKGFQETAMTLLTKFYLPKLSKNNDAITLNTVIKIQEIGTYTLETIKDEKLILPIAELMEIACEKRENIEFLCVYGQLSYRVNSLEKAKKALYRALTLSDYSENIALVLDKVEGFKIPRKRQE